MFLVICIVQLCCVAVWAHPEISTSEDDTKLIVNDAPEEKVIAIGKSVEVKKQALEVLAIGGDVVIEGRVNGDVAAVGGNVIQREGAYIAGDIIVFGGSYKPESQTPLREEGKQTIVMGMFEEQLRSLGQDPAQIFSPTFSLSFLAQRIFVALLWFVISLVFTTVAPGAVGRAVARIQLNLFKVLALGSAAFLLTTVVLVGGAALLPDYLSATLAILGMLLLLLSYVFGRVSLQVSVGKLFQKHVLSESNRSETLATLIGVVAWTLLLSLPYVWLIALFAVFTVGIGLILTGRSAPKWQST